MLTLTQASLQARVFVRLQHGRPENVPSSNNTENRKEHFVSFFMNYLTYLVNITAVTAWRALKTLFPKQTTIAVILKTFHSLQCFVNTFTNT